MDSLGEGEGGKIWENGIEMCNIMYETSRQSRFNARYWMLGAGQYTLSGVMYKCESHDDTRFLL